MPAPPVSALAQLKQLDHGLVKQVREQFLKEAQNENPDYYDQNDVEQIVQNEWQTQRFLLEQKLNPNEAYKALCSAMHWRKMEQIPGILCEDFPGDYYRSGYILRYGRDRNDATVIYFRANIHRKTIDEWNKRLKQFFIHQIEQIDRDCDGKGVTLLIDCTNIGVSNVDMDLLKFIVTSFSKYYPKLFDTILIHQLPFLLQYLFKLVQTWLPEEDRKFFHMTSKKTLEEYIAPDQLPKFLQQQPNTTSQADDHQPPSSLPNERILMAKEFVDKFGWKFGLKCGDEQKLSYLKNYFM